jgi:hypothetical protein
VTYDDIRWARDIAGLEACFFRTLLLLITTYVGSGTSASGRCGRKHEGPICYAPRQTFASQMRVAMRYE